MGAPAGARQHEAKGINTAASLAHKGDGEPISAFTSPGGRGSKSTTEGAGRHTCIYGPTRHPDTACLIFYNQSLL
jgi:hypothetical protein